MQRTYVILLAVVLGLAVGGGARILLSDKTSEGQEVATERRIDASDDERVDDPTTTSTSTTLKTIEGSTTTQTTQLTTSPTICEDETQSWNWPTTTEGPVVRCPESPFGTPDYPLAVASPGWIVVLDSIEIWDVERANESMAILTGLTDAQLLDSRSYLGLRDPYWVPFAGPFASRDEASSFCVNNSRLITCYPRELY